MKLYRIQYIFEDYLYFTSKEENRTKITFSILHNISLQYAIKNAKSSYRLYDCIPTYVSDFEQLHQKNLYLFPALPKHSINSLNSGNTISLLFNWHSDQYRTFNEQTKYNILQFSNVKLLTQENVFEGYIITSLNYTELKNQIPKYIRIGKLFTKVKTDIIELDSNIQQNYTGKITGLINPNDLPKNYNPGSHFVGDLIKMHPSYLFFNVNCLKPISIIKTTNNDIILPICEHFQHIVKGEQNE